MDVVATEVSKSHHATKEHKDAIVTAEYMIRLRELRKQRIEEDGIMSKKVKQTEKEYALEMIKERFMDIGTELAEQAVDNVVATSQSSAFSVHVKLIPTGEDSEVKVIADGKITRSAGKSMEHYSFDDQVRMDVQKEE